MSEILSLFTAFRPLSDLEIQEISAVANVFLALTAAVTIIFSAINIRYTRKALENSENDTILNNRPYVFLTPSVNGGFAINADTPDLLALKFVLANTGRSTANRVDMFIKSARLLNWSKDQSLDWDLVKVQKADDAILEVATKFKGANISVFPQQQQTLGNVILKKNGIYQILLQGNKALLLEFSLKYDSLPFGGVSHEYETHYSMVYLPGSGNSGNIEVFQTTNER